MATHGMKLLGVLAGLLLLLSGLAVAGATDPNLPAADHWEPTNRTAQSITGRVTLVPGQITFQNGKSLPLSPPSQMLFRPDKKQKVTADLYRVTQPDDPVLENGNRLCGGKSVAYLLVWKSQRIGKETDPRSINVFSGPKLVSGSSDDCGRYSYDAGAH